MATEPNGHDTRTVSERAATRLNGEVPTCRRCGVEVPAADALACVSCGFDVRTEHRGKFRFWGTITGLLVMTVVGIPLAVLTGAAALRHRRELKKGVVE